MPVFRGQRCQQVDILRARQLQQRVGGAGEGLVQHPLLLRQHPLAAGQTAAALQALHLLALQHLAAGLALAEQLVRLGAVLGQDSLGLRRRLGGDVGALGLCVGLHARDDLVDTVHRRTRLTS